MPDQGLIFIPDISGFSRFINETEIEHSRLIIQELLETLINCNEIGLEVSEIEGDAILFYKFGDPPQLKQIYRQVEKMFCQFHQNLIAYDRYQFCKCTACTSAINLTLKVISHYGQFTGYNVKNFNKLIGKDIIVAHQLLKNDIKDHEYWLVTHNLVPGAPPESLASWMTWNESAQQTEIGEIKFQYTQLGQLKHALEPTQPVDRELSSKAKLFSLTREYATDIVTLLHAVGSPSYRSQWQEGVKRVEQANHFLPRVGMKLRIFTDDGEIVTFASSYNFSAEKIEFSETDEQKRIATYYIFERIEPKHTRLTIEYYTTKDLSTQWVYKIFRKRKLMAAYRRSMQNLDGLIKDLHIPTAINE